MVSGKQAGSGLEADNSTYFTSLLGCADVLITFLAIEAAAALCFDRLVGNLCAVIAAKEVFYLIYHFVSITITNIDL